MAGLSSPLLLSHHQHHHSLEDDEERPRSNPVPSVTEPKEWLQPWRPSLSEVVEEVKHLCSIAFPLIITGLLIYGKSVASMFFMGKLGKETLAGGSLSIGIANITGYSVISGLAMGMEAISSQACGAKQWPVMGLTLIRTMAILLLFSLPISVLWLNIEPLLIFCRQDPLVSSIAAAYLTYSLPDLLFQSLINPIKIFLRTQNITVPLILSATLALALHGPINYLLVCHFRFGIEGIAIAAALTDFNLLAVLVVYLCLSDACKKSFQGITPNECLTEWKPILSLAIPSCVSVCLEWWWYELMVVLSGLLSNASEAVATMGIMIQVTSLIYIFPSSLSFAVSTRVGNALGAAQPFRAKTSSVVGLTCAVCTSLLALFFTTAARNAWGRIFTTDETILALTAAVMPVAGVCELGNCPQTAGCGVLRGSARPALGANINWGSFYGVGMPISLLMGFVLGMGLLGLWLGLVGAQVVCAVLMIGVVMKTDWGEQAEKARKLTAANDEEINRTENENESTALNHTKLPIISCFGLFHPPK